MRYTFLVTLLFFAVCGRAQDSKVLPDTSKNVFGFVEPDRRVPEPKYDLHEYLQKYLHYPEAARINNITGRVIVKFVVDRKGHIRDCEVAKGIGSGCDEEALRVVKNMPKWKPGRINNKPVKVHFTLPISFQLED
jgi:protein TonB